MTIRWTPEMRAEARRLFDAGLTYAEIGERCGVSKNIVIGYAHRNNWPKRAAAIKPSPITPDKADAIRAWFDAGIPYAAMAEWLGIDESTIQGWGYSQGLRRPKGWRSLTPRQRRAQAA